MPTPTEAAQFHIFSIKRMKYIQSIFIRKPIQLSTMVGAAFP